MSLRPRYSLLTLLVLTALVAGGVKLWYGPHHVVERKSPDKEAEYAYTRDWRGSLNVNGPVMIRRLNESGAVERLDIRYCRENIDGGEFFILLFDTEKRLFMVTDWTDDPWLLPHEKEELSQMLRRELTIYQASGYNLNPKLGE